MGTFVSALEVLTERIARLEAELRQEKAINDALRLRLAVGDDQA